MRGKRAAKMTSCAPWGMRKSGQNRGFRPTCAGDRGCLDAGPQAWSGEGASGGEDARGDGGGFLRTHVALPRAGKSPTLRRLC